MKIYMASNFSFSKYHRKKNFVINQPSTAMNPNLIETNMNNGSSMIESGIESHQEEIIGEPSEDGLSAETEVQQFADNVKRMCELQDQLKEIGKHRKQVADDMKIVKDAVMEYMIAEKVAKCNYADDEIFVNTRIANGSLSRSTLRQALEDFHGDNESDAESCFEYIIEALGKKDVIEVKRRKRKSKPATVKRVKKQARMIEQE